MTIQYILVDGARAGYDIHTLKELNPNFMSLYKGESEQEFEGIAPYLFTWPENNRFSSWICKNSWGSASCILLNSNQTFRDSWQHFRKFLLVKTEDNQELYFRFYDPRVLKIFLPTCDKEQIIEFFGPIQHFIVEGDSKEEAIEFSHQNGELKQRVIPVEQVFGDVIRQQTVTDNQIT